MASRRAHLQQQQQQRCGPLDKTSPLHKDLFEEKVKQLEHAIAEKSRKLDAIKLEKIRAKEATAESTKEMGRRLALVVETPGVADALLEFGRLVRREGQLEEMLQQQHGPTATDRKLPKRRACDPSNLQDMEDMVTEKAEGLRAQVVEVTRLLGEMRSRSLAAVVSEMGQGETSLISDVQDKMVCTTCRWPLNNREEQRRRRPLGSHWGIMAAIMALFSMAYVRCCGEWRRLDARWGLAAVGTTQRNAPLPS
ncbi:unnamed protein product [Merluccius merluccius]